MHSVAILAQGLCYRPHCGLFITSFWLVRRKMAFRAASVLLLVLHRLGCRPCFTTCPKSHRHSVTGARILRYANFTSKSRSYNRALGGGARRRRTLAHGALLTALCSLRSAHCALLNERVASPTWSPTRSMVPCGHVFRGASGRPRWIFRDP